MNEWIIRRIIALSFLARVFYHVIARHQTKHSIRDSSSEQNKARRTPSERARIEIREKKKKHQLPIWTYNSCKVQLKYNLCATEHV